MKTLMLMTCGVLALLSAPAAAQSGAPRANAAQEKVEQAKETALRAELERMQAALKEQQAQNNPRFVRTLTNVQIELSLTDQIGTQAPEKKTVSMIASSGSWGKIRSSGHVFPPGEPPYAVELNVDARPFVSTEGQVQLELTFVYAPLKSGGDPKEGPKPRPSGINQSQTVILQSGRPLVVSQAADPISDRKVVVEVKATVLK
jgi:hypothetical protein